MSSIDNLTSYNNLSSFPVIYQSFVSVQNLAEYWISDSLVFKQIYLSAKQVFKFLLKVHIIVEVIKDIDFVKLNQKVNITWIIESLCEDWSKNIKFFYFVLFILYKNDYSLQAPPIAVFKVKNVIRFLVISNYKVFRIPFDRLATHSQTDISELTCFG